RQDASERNAIEGKFGEGKRTYGLGLISACLQNTSETAISISFIMMNIGKILRDSFFTFLLIFHVTFSKENNHIYSISVTQVLNISYSVAPTYIIPYL